MQCPGQSFIRYFTGKMLQPLTGASSRVCLRRLQSHACKAVIVDGRHILSMDICRLHAIVQSETVHMATFQICKTWTILTCPKAIKRDQRRPNNQIDKQTLPEPARLAKGRTPY